MVTIPETEQATHGGAGLEQAIKPAVALAINVDAASLASLRLALGEWNVEVLTGASLRALGRDWRPARADMLVLGASADAGEALGLCRALRSQAGRARIPLVVLLSAEQRGLARELHDAGASGCLVRPIICGDLANIVKHACRGNQPGRHTLDLNRAQRADLWRDCGGEG